MVGTGFTLQAQATWQDAFGFETAFHGIAHHIPNFAQVVKDRLAFVFQDIFPEDAASLAIPLEDAIHCGIGISHGGRLRLAKAFAQETTTDAINLPMDERGAAFSQAFELHPVRMEGQEGIRLPNNLGAFGAQNIQDRLIGQVALAGGSERTVKGYAKLCRLRCTRQEGLCRTTRAHGMRTRRSNTNLKNILYRVHGFQCLLKARRRKSVRTAST